MLLAFEADGVLDIAMALELDDDGADHGGADHEGADHGAADNRPTDPLVTRVIDALRPRRGQTVDELARAVGESAERIRSMLGRLDLEGHAARGADGLWRGIATAVASTSAASAS
jgi:DNA processing protein